MTGLAYPRALRASLAESLRLGRTFPKAWRLAVTDCPPPDDWRNCMVAVRPVWRDAYEGIGPDLGRLSVLAEQDTGFRDPPAHAAPDGCRWGGGCDGSRGHGMTGLFCAEHASILATIANASRLSGAAERYRVTSFDTRVVA